MLNTNFKGNQKDVKSIGKLPFLPESVFIENGKGETYEAKAHSLAGVITGKKGGKYQLINASVADAGLVTFVADVDESITEGQELVLTFEGIVDERMRFNAVRALPKA